MFQNLAWNQQNKAGGGGEEVYFVVSKAEQSLRLHGREVWSYGEAPNMGLRLSAVRLERLSSI